MSAVRTQIYLTEEQRAQIDSITEASGLTLAEVVRRALDTYLDTEFPDPDSALRSTFGSLPDAESPSRDEWSRG